MYTRAPSKQWVAFPAVVTTVALKFLHSGIRRSWTQVELTVILLGHLIGFN